MKWIRLWAVLAMAFVAGHLVITTLVPETPPWTKEFFTRLAVVPLAEAAVVGALLLRAAKRTGTSKVE